MINKENVTSETLQLLNAREAAAYLRISISTLNRMEARGELRSLKTPGGHRRYTATILNACLAGLRIEENKPDGN